MKWFCKSYFHLNAKKNSGKRLKNIENKITECDFFKQLYIWGLNTD